MVKDYLASRTATLTESATLALNAKAKTMAANGKTIYNLTAGELATDTPQNIQKAVSKSLNHNKYTAVSGLPKLREAIAVHAKKYYGLDWIESNNVVVTAGAKPALYAAFLSLINPGDEVILPTPAWVSYVDLIQMVGGIVKEVPLTDKYDLDPSAIQNAITSKTKAVVINSPHNPTGAIFTKNSVTQVSKIINDNNITVISDDIYSKLVYITDYFLPAKAKFKKIIIINGFSKSQALTGWRIGYLIASEPVSKAATSFLSHITGNAPLPSQYAAIEAMANNDTPPQSTMNDLKMKRALVIEGLSQIPGIKFNIPGGAFYVYLDLRQVTDNSIDWCESLLQETGVAIVPGDAFLTPGFARLTFVGDVKTLNGALEQLKAFVIKDVSLMRKIPATMATQHPDNANAPYWANDNNPFISVYKEIPEAVHCFEDLGVSEYMWDWEGKHADAAVIDRLFSDYYDYFSKYQLGKDKFLTFRIPNIWEEKGYNLLQAMTVILSSEDFARDLKLNPRPLFEIILPMTQNAQQLMHMQKLFQKLAKFKSKEFTSDSKANTDYLEMIPLVESVESQLAISKLLENYMKLHTKHFGYKPLYLRPFLARSDPALVSGSLATVLANKLAISRVYEFSKKNNIPVYPISGVGSLPFRGGLTPSSVDEYLKEYPGMRTASIQSSFRYDSSLRQVRAAITKLEKEMPKTKPMMINQAEQKTLEGIVASASKNYQKFLYKIVPDLQTSFDSVPKRRDRRQHIGLLAYGRNMSGVELPRAITFTSGFYSIGLPPEFIGIGASLKKLSLQELVLIKKTYKYLEADLIKAGHYLNKSNLTKLVARNPAWNEVFDDIKLAEEILGLKFGPTTPDEITHAELSKELIECGNQAERKELIEEMALLRKSLG